VNSFYPVLFCFLLLTSAYSQETVSKNRSLIQPFTTENNNYPSNSWNEIIGKAKLKIDRSSLGESLMGNLICEAMLLQTEADFAFISFGELYSDLYMGDITRLDLFRLIPFNRMIVVLEMSGDTLKQVIENTLGGIHSGLAIAGGKVEYDPNRPVQNRLTFVQVGDYSLYPKKKYRVVTIDYLANGNAGFKLLKEIDPTQVFRTGVLLREALADHIRQNSPLDQTKISIDNRWIKN
jgi:2',3'-cyclic-nucleotide 2'-phosphodiesterase (5'-nucleotidase family)